MFTKKKITKNLKKKLTVKNSNTKIDKIFSKDVKDISSYVKWWMNFVETISPTFIKLDKNIKNYIISGNISLILTIYFHNPALFTQLNIDNDISYKKPQDFIIIVKKNMKNTSNNHKNILSEVIVKYNDKCKYGIYKTNNKDGIGDIKLVHPSILLNKYKNNKKINNILLQLKLQFPESFDVNNALI
jgi:hypothetical protein